MGFIFYIFVGFFGGICSGLLGLGGGIIVVPLLVFYFHYLDLAPSFLFHLAIGTSLASMVTTTACALYIHLRKGTNLEPTLKRMAAGVLIGCFIGASCAHFCHTKFLSTLFALFALFTAFQLFFNKKWDWVKRYDSPRIEEAASLTIGTFSALLGLGAGTVSLPYLSQLLPMKDAIGVSAALSLLVSLLGTLVYLVMGTHQLDLPPYTTGYIYWPAVVGINITSPLAAMWSARYAQSVPGKSLRKIFAAVLLFIGAHMLYIILK